MKAGKHEYKHRQCSGKCHKEGWLARTSSIKQTNNHTLYIPAESCLSLSGLFPFAPLLPDGAIETDWECQYLDVCHLRHQRPTKQRKRESDVGLSFID